MGTDAEWPTIWVRPLLRGKSIGDALTSSVRVFKEVPQVLNATAQSAHFVGEKVPGDDVSHSSDGGSGVEAETLQKVSFVAVGWTAEEPSGLMFVLSPVLNLAIWRTKPVILILSVMLKCTTLLRNLIAKRTNVILAVLVSVLTSARETPSRTARKKRARGDVESQDADGSCCSRCHSELELRGQPVSGLQTFSKTSVEQNVQQGPRHQRRRHAAQSLAVHDQSRIRDSDRVIHSDLATTCGCGSTAQAPKSRYEWPRRT